MISGSYLSCITSLTSLFDQTDCISERSRRHRSLTLLSQGRPLLLLLSSRYYPTLFCRGPTSGESTYVKTGLKGYSGRKRQMKLQ